VTRRLGLLYVAVILLGVSSFATLALAHSFPESETPPAGATLAQPPSQIVIKYDAPIEKLFASIKVVNGQGQDVAAGAPAVSADGSELSIQLSKLAPGNYTVEWRVVCIDTHHTEGSYGFSVAGAPQ